MIHLVHIDLREHHYSTVPPLGLLSLGSFMKREGVPFTIHHIDQYEMEQTARLIADDPKGVYVGFSTISGPQTRCSAEMSQMIRRLKPELPIVWGGVHPSLLSTQCMKEDYIDFVVVKEGDDAAVELYRCLTEGRPFSEVGSLWYKENGQVRNNPTRPFVDFSSPRYDYDYSIVDVPGRYFSKLNYRGRLLKRIIAYKASRGCTFDCNFCYVPMFHNRRFRVKSAERVIDDLLELKSQYGVDGVSFYDDEFFLNQKRAVKILQAIDLPFAADITFHSLAGECWEYIKTAPVIGFLIGLESGNERILNNVVRVAKKAGQVPLTVEHLKKKVLKLASAHVPVTYSAILGSPTETVAEMLDTIRLGMWIESVHAEANFTFGAYMPYPGSELYNLALEHGFKPPEKTEDWGFLDRWTPDVAKLCPWQDGKALLRIREYFRFMNYKVSALDQIARWRLENGVLAFPADIALINALYFIATDNESTTMRKAVRWLHSKMRRKYETPHIPHETLALT